MDSENHTPKAWMTFEYYCEEEGVENKSISFTLNDISEVTHPELVGKFCSFLRAVGFHLGDYEEIEDEDDVKALEAYVFRAMAGQDIMEGDNKPPPYIPTTSPTQKKDEDSGFHVDFTSAFTNPSANSDPTIWDHSKWGTSTDEQKFGYYLTVGVDYIGETDKPSENLEARITRDVYDSIHARIHDGRLHEYVCGVLCLNPDDVRLSQLILGQDMTEKEIESDE